MGSLFAWDVFFGGKILETALQEANITGYYSDAAPGVIGKQICHSDDGKVMFLESKGNYVQENG